MAAVYVCHYRIYFCTERLGVYGSASVWYFPGAQLIALVRVTRLHNGNRNFNKQYFAISSS
jgi:hypothetical protein